MTSSCIASPTVQELWSNLFNETVIVWQAPTNHLPPNLWVYQRMSPTVFSETVLSNAIVLSSLEDRGFPKPSTNDFFISEDRGPNYPCAVPVIFSISPNETKISYSMPGYGMDSGDQLPSDEAIQKQAWQNLVKLELDPKNFIQRNMFDHFCEADSHGMETTNNICGRGVFLARRLDGIEFFSADNEGLGAEGFSIEFGDRGKTRSFSMRCSKVERTESQPIAKTQELIQCMKAHKTIVLPNPAEADYFARLKQLASAKKCTITKITPYYGEGTFGEIPVNGVPSKWVMPVVELEVVADLENTNMTVRLLSPILASEVKRVLAKP